MSIASYTVTYTIFNIEMGSKMATYFAAAFLQHFQQMLSQADSPDSSSVASNTYYTWQNT